MRFFNVLLLISMSAFSQMSDDPNNWTVVTDQVMGGKSELKADYDQGTIQLKGYVTTQNNGGFVRLAHRPESISNDIKGIKCIECISVYDTDFEIQEIGICYNKGQA